MTMEWQKLVSTAMNKENDKQITEEEIQMVIKKLKETERNAN